MAATCEKHTCYCSAEEVVGAMGRKYAIPLLCALAAHDALRFGEIESHYPEASTSTLSTRLDELADLGLVSRTQYDEIPPRVEYTLTDDGVALADLLEPIVEWAGDRR